MSDTKVCLPWIIAILLIALCSADDHGKVQTWGYDKDDGPSRWGKMYPDECGEQRHRQSPVNINTSAVQFIEDFEEISIVYQKNDEHKMSVLNNGHTVKVNVEGPVDIVGGGLGDSYRIIQFHFHWGAEDDQGSEHRINGKSSPLEMHMVSYDSNRFNNLQEALSDFNSLAVVGTLFEISEEDNPVFDSIINAVEAVAHMSPKETVDIEWVDPQSMIPPKTNHFFRYDGSLTTPPCLENVIWTVFSEKQTISKAQLNKFRGCFHMDKDGEEVPLVDNYRPPQPLHQRQVYASFQPKVATKHGDDHNGSSIVTSSVVLIMGMIVAFLKFL